MLENKNTTTTSVNWGQHHIMVLVVSHHLHNSGRIEMIISMARCSIADVEEKPKSRTELECKNAVSPLLMHWSYFSFTINQLCVGHTGGLVVSVKCPTGCGVPRGTPLWPLSPISSPREGTVQVALPKGPWILIPWQLWCYMIIALNCPKNVEMWGNHLQGRIHIMVDWNLSSR